VDHPDLDSSCDRAHSVLLGRAKEINRFRTHTFFGFSRTFFWLIFVCFLSAGCARLFGWEIHAPGLLSQNYYDLVDASPHRLALYLPDEVMTYESENRGGRFADPQTYHIGESFTPILIEAFQHGFDEFIFIEAEPTPAIMRRYGIPYLAVVQIKEFGNRVTLKGQAVGLRSEVLIFNPDLDIVARFEVDGSSDAQKVFAKKGGPEVNLNAALENNARVTVESLQDWVGGQHAA